MSCRPFICDHAPCREVEPYQRFQFLTGTDPDRFYEWLRHTVPLLGKIPVPDGFTFYSWSLVEGSVRVAPDLRTRALNYPHESDTYPRLFALATCILRTDEERLTGDRPPLYGDAIGFTFRPKLGDQWEVTAEYDELFWPWIDSLQRDAGGNWLVGVPVIPPELRSVLDKLSGQDKQMIELWRKGYTAAQIGKRIPGKRKAKTVHEHIGNLRRVLGEEIVPFRRKPRENDGPEQPGS